MTTPDDQSYVTYRLRNGTHILIHNSNKPKDNDKPKPAQCILTNSPPSNSNADISTESSEILVEEADIGWSMDASSAMVMEPTTEEILEFLPENCIDRCEVVVSFKCKYCEFLSEDKNEFIRHFEECHSPEKGPVKVEEVEESVVIEFDNGIELNAAEEEFEDHDPVLMYLCGECNEVLNDLEDCREHMKDVHNILMAADSGDGEEDKDVAFEEEGSITDDPDISKANDKATMRPSDEQATESAWWKESDQLVSEPTIRSYCTVPGCQMDFAREEMRVAHARCHCADFGRVFRCSECAKPFASRWRACVQHLWKKHAINAGMINCSVCKEYWTLGARKMANHLRTHGEARPFACDHPGCGKGFKQQSQLRNHRVLHLDRNTARVPRWYSSQKCEICQKTYADSKCLKKHVQSVHRRLRPYVCSVCGHASARKAMLQMHHRQHTGEKPYGCDQCAYRTGDHNSLRRHKMRHNGQRPYQCPHCSYASIQSNSYKNHLRNKHPGMHGAFECAECDFRTVSEEAHIGHVRDHARASPADADLFPENEMAANLICHSIAGGRWPDDDRWRDNVLEKTTSADGMTQTITIKLPADDDGSFLDGRGPEEEEEGVDTGGITIPAEPDDGEPGREESFTVFAERIDSFAETS